MVWLTEAAEALIHRTRRWGVDEAARPARAIHPDLGGIDRRVGSVRSGRRRGLDRPSQVVFVGHFDDRRAELCPAAERPSAAIASWSTRSPRVDGVEQPLSHVTSVDGTAVLSTLDKSGRWWRWEASISPVLSVVTADDGNVAHGEPSSRAGSGPGPLWSRTR